MSAAVETADKNKDAPAKEVVKPAEVLEEDDEFEVSAQYFGDR